MEDDDGLIDSKEGEPGEVWVRGPSVMKVNCYSIPPLNIDSSSSFHRDI